jgi:cytochrome c oxidase subunit 2
MKLPVGDPGKPIFVHITLTSVDTVYGLEIPAYKIDAKADPNAPQSLWIEPTAVATITSQCTVGCEGPKARMLLQITAESSADFRTWAMHQKELPTASSNKMPGRIIFEHSACVSCHTLAGTTAAGRFGPDLTHFASRAKLAGGTVPNTAANLKAFLNDPTQLKPGCVMPPAHLAPHDLDAVAAYLSNLQ